MILCLLLPIDLTLVPLSPSLIEQLIEQPAVEVESTVGLSPKFTGIKHTWEYEYLMI